MAPRNLQVELCALQVWVQQEGLRVVQIFERRDAAGNKKGTGLEARSWGTDVERQVSQTPLASRATGGVEGALPKQRMLLTGPARWRFVK